MSEAIIVALISGGLTLAGVVISNSKRDAVTAPLFWYLQLLNSPLFPLSPPF